LIRLPNAKKVNTMKHHFYLLSFGIGAMILAATHAQSAPTCADHATVVARLEGQYGEERQAMGLGTNNTVVEVYASSETGSWTITVTQPGGPTCLVAAGDAFHLETQSEPVVEGNDA
jgi:cation diffusion facilitator CzcD-associated flavoprotein CzcO